MRREIKYKCEYCSLRLSNRLDMAKHEAECKEYTTQQKRIVALFESLHRHYIKLGWQVYIIAKDGEIDVNIFKRRK